jgi:hypothetical protein
MNSALLAAFIALYVIPFAVTMLKGKFTTGLVSLFIGGPFLTTFAAVRLAKPISWWACHTYDADKLARSRERFDHSHTGGDYVAPPIAELFR